MTKNYFKHNIAAIAALLTAGPITASAQTTFMKVVAADGTGDYTTVQQAVNACSTDGTRNFVFIKNGTYEGQVKVPKGVTLSLLGEDRDKVVITHAVSHASGKDKDETSTLYVEAYDMYGQGFTTQNTVGRNGGQAECLTNDGDRLTLRDVAMKANQDAVRFDNASRTYICDSYIEGTVDYIYDSGIAFIDNTTIKQLYPGYIIAPGDSYVSVSRAKSSELCGQKKIWQLGINIRDSKLVCDAANVGNGASYLGRPWGKTTSAGMFIRCKMDKHISDAGFTNMSEGNKKYIGEYKSMDLDGNPIDVSKRIDWEFTEDASHNSQYIDEKVVNTIYDMDYVYTLAGESGARAGGSFSPLPLVTPTAVPVATADGKGTFNWAATEGSIGYLIYKDGRYVANTTATSYTDASYSSSSTYALRTVSQTGCMSALTSMSTSGIHTVEAAEMGLTVSADGIHFGEPAQAALYSMSGSLLAATSGSCLNWNDAPKGCYILRARTADGKTLCRKIVRR